MDGFKDRCLRALLLLVLLLLVMVMVMVVMAMVMVCGFGTPYLLCARPSCRRRRRSRLVRSSLCVSTPFARFVLLAAYPFLAASAKEVKT